VDEAYPGVPVPARGLLTSRLSGGELAGWPTDLLGVLEGEGPALASARYTGHPDRRAALLLERFFDFTEDSVTVCEAGLAPRPARRPGPERDRRKFRGGAFATGGSLDAVEFAVRAGRNEDFSLALSQLVTSRRRLRPAECAAAYIRHERGTRHCGPFVAHRQEREGDRVDAILEDIAAGYDARYPDWFDPWRFREFGHGYLRRHADRWAGLGEELFAEGMRYRRRARAHLRLLGSAGPASAAAWYADPAPARAAALRSAAAVLRAHREPRGRALAEAAQVLVPAGVLTTVDRRGMRHGLRSLSDRAREAAAARLEREAAWWDTTTGVGHGGGNLADAIRRKRDRTVALVAEIEADLGGTGPDARDRFAAAVRARVHEDACAFLDALPYAYALRARVMRAAGWRG
jgi:hypothetical protein